MEDLYSILKISKNATKEQIKEAYHKRAKELHPDSGSNPDPEAFINLKKAYDVLSDDFSREKYDKSGCIPLSEQELQQMSFVIINNSITSFISNDNLNINENILNLMINKCNEIVSSCSRDIKLLEWRLKRTLSMKRRIKHRNELIDNEIFKKIFIEKEFEIRAAIGNVQQKLEIYRFVKRLLCGYEYIIQGELQQEEIEDEKNLPALI